MERDYLKKQLKLRLIVYCALAILLYGAAAQFNTSVHGLIKRSDKPVKVLLLSSPPIFIAYNPEFKKAVVNNLPNTKKALSAQEILQKAKIEQDKVIIIDIRGQKRIEFWEKFKNNLQSWQKKPYIIFQYLYAYIKLKCEGKTDLSFGDFILISTELSTLQPSDFAVQNPLVDKIIKGRKQQEAAISITTDIKPNQTAKGPLIVEVLNASGKNGLAGEVTKFLRERNNSGILNVDVISYGTSQIFYGARIEGTSNSVNGAPITMTLITGMANYATTDTVVFASKYDSLDQTNSPATFVNTNIGPDNMTYSWSACESEYG